MRRKIETLLDERVLERAKARAAREGKALNDLLEAALKTYLAQHPVRSSQRVVDEGWGAFRVTRRQLREALKAHPFDV